MKKLIGLCLLLLALASQVHAADDDADAKRLKKLNDTRAWLTNEFSPWLTNTFPTITFEHWPDWLVNPPSRTRLPTWLTNTFPEIESEDFPYWLERPIEDELAKGIPDFSAAASFAASMARVILAGGLPPDTLLNVNVPSLPVDEIRGHAITRQGKRRYDDAIVENVDPRVRIYYWIGGSEMGFVSEEGTDFAAIQAGLISVTPLHLDLTNYASIARLTNLDVKWR